MPGEFRSFAGALAIEVAEGTLVPGIVSIGPGHAELKASFVPSGTDRERSPGSIPAPFRTVDKPFARRPPRLLAPNLDDLAVVDDCDNPYTVRVIGSSGSRQLSGGIAEVIQLELAIEPIPNPAITWLELRNGTGSRVRLLPSDRGSVTVGAVTRVAASPLERELSGLAHGLIRLRLMIPQRSNDAILAQRCEAALARISEIQHSGELAATSLASHTALLALSLLEGHDADGLPVRWSTMLSGAHQSDGQRRHLDIGVTLPSLDGLILRLDHLISDPDAWRIYLSAYPTWWQYSDSRRSKESPVSVQANDDLGNAYLGLPGGGSGRDDHVQVIVGFVPRLASLAHEVCVRFQGTENEVDVKIDLAPVVQS